MAGLNEIRTSFLDFFKRHDHEVVASSSLVPHNDPTLLFTNAGMVQFKNVFTGIEQRPYVRAATSQKCVRAGGKHNDLDNVGYTARHHTFFEMLGNFSFGDYFKEQAIEHAWNLLTQDFGLPKDKLLATVYAEDEEAFQLWKKIAGFPDHKIIRIATSDNFWSMGDTGPCGPCSEIFYDHGEGIPGGPPGSPEEDGDRFIEIWNLVFMQFDQQADGERQPLPRPSIDTGMGLERVGAVLQGVHNNYDTDLFKNLIAAMKEYIAPSANAEEASYRVIVDHIRSMSFLIADGVLPSNEGRGYVLRRIMRRAMRHAHMLGESEPVIWRLVADLVRLMGAAYPDLGRAEALVRETVRSEEERFQKMLGRGLQILEDETQGLGTGDALAGSVAFKLYDTYGFPLDLTQDALRGRGIRVDVAGFDQEMERQKAEARAAWAGSGETATEEIWYAIRERTGATEFLGYAQDTGQGIVQGILVDGAEVTAAEKGQAVDVILNQTPFYAESGGQVGDRGVLSHDECTVAVQDTKKKLGDLHVHRGAVMSGQLKVGDVVDAAIDRTRRSSIRSNHSATHLVHAALRDVLGPHVTQKGSLVDADRLRFDFSHSHALTAEQIEAIEAQVNAVIQQNAQVSTRLMSPEDAIAAGAMALFGEKYGEEVRVLSMGHALAEDEQTDIPYSVELCGGTHVGRVGDITLFKIVSEGAVASGVRRIEAVTGEAARQYLLHQAGLAITSAGLLKSRPDELPVRLAQMLDERKKLEREIADLRKQVALGGGAGAVAQDNVKDVGGLKVLARRIENMPAKDLRGMVDDGKSQVGSGVVAMVTVNDGKAAIAVGVTDDLTQEISAVDLVRVGAEALGGKGGGGRADMAQAGGPDGAQAQKALDDIVKFLEAR